MDLLSLIVILLIVFWLCGFAFQVGGSLIHALLVIAVIVLIARLLQGRPVP